MLHRGGPYVNVKDLFLTYVNKMIHGYRYANENKLMNKIIYFHQ